MTLRQAEKKFHNAVVEWAKADQECRRFYAQWDQACARLKRLAAEKNDAWGEKEMARAAESAKLKARVARIRLQRA